MNTTIKIGSTGQIVKDIQTILKLNPDGDYGPMTAAAVKNFQIKHGLAGTGEVDTQTYDLLFPDNETVITSDLSETQLNINGINIQPYMMPSKEYLKEKSKKKSIYIHHTAGWDNPYNVIDSWKSDARGAVGSHYIIGGINPVTDDTTYDGRILQCVPDEYYVYHLGVKTRRILDRESIGIELCNFGWATLGTNSRYQTYTGTKINAKYLCKIDKFRGYEYWLRYSDEQIINLKSLIIHIANEHDIDIDKGLKSYLNKYSRTKAFEYMQNVVDGKEFGLFCHSTVRKDKYDCFPQNELCDMILSL